MNDGQISVPSSAVETLAAKLEEYIDANRRLRNQLRIREAELLELKGPCTNRLCRFHHAHSGPCDVQPASGIQQ